MLYDFIDTKSDRYRRAINYKLTQEQMFTYIKMRDAGYTAQHAMQEARKSTRRFAWKHPVNGKSILYDSVKAGSFLAILRVLHDENYNPASIRGKFSNKIREVERRKAALIVPESYRDNRLNRYFLPCISIEEQRKYYASIGYSKHDAYTLARSEAKRAMNESTGKVEINGYVVEVTIKDVTNEEHMYIAKSTSYLFEMLYDIEDNMGDINEIAYDTLVDCVDTCHLYINHLRESSERNLFNLIRQQ